jgi:molybdopterin molybdotransferase
VREIDVRRRVRAAVVAIGSELADPSAATVPPAGRVFNSNSIALRGLLEDLNCAVDYRGIAPDEPGEHLAAVTAPPDRYDLVISSGGVSVGRHDAVHRTWLALGARQVAGRVSLRPGGPFFAGRLGAAWVVGLSGTPVACLAAFHLLVQPLVRRLQGRTHLIRPLRTVQADAPLPRAGEGVRAVWARLPNPWERPSHAKILTGAPGGDYASVLGATALVLLAPGTPALAAGSRVPALLLDQGEDRDRLVLPRPEPGAAVVGVTGVSGGGKTTVLAGIVRILAASGVRVASVKHAAHGFTIDRPGSDSARLADAGAHLVMLAGPDETALRIVSSVRDGDHAALLAAEAAVAAWGRPPDVIFIEGFQHSGRPVIQVGDQKPDAAGTPVATIAAADGLSPDQLRPELERLADWVRALLPPR